MKPVDKTGALPQHALELAFQIKSQSGPHLILSSQKEEFSKIRSALLFLEPEQNIFSLEEHSLFWQDSLDFSLQSEHRLFLFLSQILQARAGDIFMCPPFLLLKKLPPLSLFKQKNLVLKKGEIFTASKASTLSLLGYQNRARVEQAGEFSLRGGVVDIFCSLPDPVRIELIGEEITQIKTFNVESQRSQKELDQVNVPPVQEWCLYDKKELYRKLKEKFGTMSPPLVSKPRSGGSASLVYQPTSSLKKSPPKVIPPLVSKPRSGFVPFWKWNDFLLHHKEAFLVEGEENMDQKTKAPLFSTSSSSFSILDFLSVWKPSVIFSDSQPPTALVDYFPKKPCIWHLDSLEGLTNLKKEVHLFLKENPLFPRFEDIYFDSFPHKKSFSTEKLSEKKEGLSSVDPAFYSQRFFSSSNWPQKIKEQREKGFLIFIFSPKKEAKKELTLKLNQVGMNVKKESSWWNMKTTQENSSLVLHLIESVHFDNLIWPKENLIFLHPPKGTASLADRGTASLTYQPTSSLKKSQPDVNPPLVNNSRSGFFATLKPGDLVVHKSHGIALFKSLQVLDFGLGNNEFLILQYQDKELLYVPVYALQMVQKYTAPFSLQTKKKLLDKLGGKRWLNTKIRAHKKIQNLTLELMSLYQTRAVLKRKRFSLPTKDFKKFEREFSFKETPDQQKAILDILNDLTQKDQPADRLIAGDTGFGKTEIAMRAVFKVIEDGLQVGLMAPTTLLSFQHFEKFKERFKPWPITLRLLNRFTSFKERTETLNLVKEGKIDILIGTHTLLGREIEFKKLGLLIIDEEHLFGVQSKEKLKNRYKTVDTLSLSATPLPRSLSMGLSRLRDMSAVLTPPLNRKPVQTLVSPFNKGLIKTAIQKELNRGGQVIFIHNRVRDIKEMEKKLKELLPSSVRIRTAHGQTKNLREKIALDFFYQRFDVLLCTTIVESGMDFPNANTLFINQAEQFGLSQLHQIRGRTGRSDKTAYCYMLIKSQISKQAVERLKIIQENSFPGAGMAIARYDLEMRGAGELMGREQSGFLKDIGYEMYFEFLQKNILNLQNNKSLSMEEEPDLKLPHSAFIPSDYIPHEKTRLFFYKKLAVVESIEEITQIKKELIDFAGSLPEEAENLISISRIRMFCKSHLVRELSYRKNLLTFYFAENAPALKQTIKHSDYNPKKRALKISLKTETLAEIEDICIKYFSI